MKMRALMMAMAVLVAGAAYGQGGIKVGRVVFDDDTEMSTAGGSGDKLWTTNDSGNIVLSESSGVFLGSNVPVDGSGYPYAAGIFGGGMYFTDSVGGGQLILGENGEDGFGLWHFDDNALQWNNLLFTILTPTAIFEQTDAMDNLWSTLDYLGDETQTRQPTFIFPKEIRVPLLNAVMNIVMQDTTGSFDTVFDHASEYTGNGSSGFRIQVRAMGTPIATLAENSGGWHTPSYFSVDHPTQSGLRIMFDSNGLSYNDGMSTYHMLNIDTDNSTVKIPVGVAFKIGEKWRLVEGTDELVVEYFDGNEWVVSGTFLPPTP